MIENERKTVVKRINETKEKIKLLNSLKEHKIELEQLVIIREYLNLVDNVLSLEKSLDGINEANVVENEFAKSINFQKRFSCKHDIWLFAGSFTDYTDEQNQYLFLLEDELDKNFSFNKYVCLECGEVVKEHNFSTFEENHFVLKNRDDINVATYIKMYYQLLYNHSVCNSQLLIIDEFNKKKIKRK